MRPERSVLPKINSLTKYPSIPTYHAIGERGLLQPTFITLPENVIATEKVHGANARVVLLPRPWEGFLVGSREDLLYYSGDLLHNPAQGIVEGLRELFEPFAAYRTASDSVEVFFLEVYGHKISDGAKWYTGASSVGFRLFDVATVDISEKLDWSVEKIAAWRDAGGQSWNDEDDLSLIAKVHDLELTPRIEIDHVPTDITETLEFLHRVVPKTRCSLDGLGTGRAEGLVVRSPDRGVIVKLRFDDYERTIKKAGKVRP